MFICVYFVFDELNNSGFYIVCDVVKDYVEGSCRFVFVFVGIDND